MKKVLVACVIAIVFCCSVVGCGSKVNDLGISLDEFLNAFNSFEDNSASINVATLNESKQQDRWKIDKGEALTYYQYEYPETKVYSDAEQEEVSLNSIDTYVNANNMVVQIDAHIGNFGTPITETAMAIFNDCISGILSAIKPDLQPSERQQLWDKIFDNDGKNVNVDDLFFMINFTDNGELSYGSFSVGTKGIEIVDGRDIWKQ